MAPARPNGKNARWRWPYRGRKVVSTRSSHQAHSRVSCGARRPCTRPRNGPLGAYLSERLVSVVRKTGLIFPTPHERGERLRR